MAAEGSCVESEVSGGGDSNWRRAREKDKKLNSYLLCLLLGRHAWIERGVAMLLSLLLLLLGGQILLAVVLSASWPPHHRVGVVAFHAAAATGSSTAAIPRWSTRRFRLGFFRFRLGLRLVRLLFGRFGLGPFFVLAVAQEQTLAGRGQIRGGRAVHRHRRLQLGVDRRRPKARMVDSGVAVGVVVVEVVVDVVEPVEVFVLLVEERLQVVIIIKAPLRIYIQMMATAVVVLNVQVGGPRGRWLWKLTVLRQGCGCADRWCRLVLVLVVEVVRGDQYEWQCWVFVAGWPPVRNRCRGRLSWRSRGDRYGWNVVRLLIAATASGSTATATCAAFGGVVRATFERFGTGAGGAHDFFDLFAFLSLVFELIDGCYLF